MATEHQYEDFPIPEGLTDAQKERLGDLIIDHIIRRTEKGKDRDGVRFPGYSDQYKKSLDFKIAGKSPRKVNLTLSGDMLASMEVLKTTRNKLRIGFEKGSEENARADGNIRGTYGKQSENDEKKRDFLGLEPGAMDLILTKVLRGDKRGKLK